MLPLIALLLGKGVISIRIQSRLHATRLHRVLFQCEFVSPPPPTSLSPEGLSYRQHACRMPDLGRHCSFSTQVAERFTASFSSARSPSQRVSLSTAVYTIAGSRWGLPCLWDFLYGYYFIKA